MDAKRCKAGCWKIAARDCVEVSAKGLRRSMRLSPLLVRVCPKKYLLYFFLHFFAMLLQQPHSEKAFEKLYEQGEQDRLFVRNLLKEENIETVGYIAIFLATMCAIFNAGLREQGGKQPQQVEAKP